MTAPATPPAADSATLQERGRVVLTAFYAAVRALDLYPLENQATQNSLDELHRSAGGLLAEEGVIELRMVGDFAFLNDVRLRLDLSNYGALALLAGALDRHGIGAFAVERGIGREEWAPFLSLLSAEAHDGDDEPFDVFTDRLSGAAAGHISVAPQQESDEPLAEDDHSKEAAKRSYCQSVQVAREVLTDVRLGKAVSVRRVKRAVQSIVDQVVTNETSIVGMTTLRDFDEYTFTHCVNVCIFSVVLGRKLSLSKLQLYELGLCALFHDIGKMRLDREMVQKPGKLTDEEWQRMRQHPTEGLLEIFSLHGFGEVPYRAMLAAYEHHMKVDVSGYPENRRARRLGLFSRIIAVTDAFDAATSQRSYQKLPLRPDEIFRRLLEHPEYGFDPLLVKAFINATGIYPIGTLAILDTYEVAVVVAPNPDRDRLSQPVVKIIMDEMGAPLAEPEVADLSEADPATGRPVRTIIKTTDPDKYGVNVSDYVA